MKKMTCKQLGGACDEEFEAITFDEIAAMSQNHAMKMFHQEDEAHLKAMEEMQQLIQSPEAMKVWVNEKRKEFNTLDDMV